MSSIEPSLRTSQPDWFEALLPPSAIPLIIILLLIFPIFILAAESLFAPVIEYVQSLLLPVNAGMNYTELPLELILKIIIFSILTFTGITLLLLKMTCLYHEVWSIFLGQPHRLHTPYHPDQQESMVALFNWTLFRWYKIFGPPLGWGVLLILTASFWFWFSNLFTDFGFLTFQLQFTVGFFAVAVLGLFTLIALFKAISAVLTTILGDVAAITEPEKPAQVIYERAQKLAFISPLSLILYPLIGLFYLIILAAIVVLMIEFDIQDVMHLDPGILVVYGIEVILLIAFLGLSAFKFGTYHDALRRYYHQHVR